jgi:hypothetical protein
MEFEAVGKDDVEYSVVDHGIGIWLAPFGC